MLALMAFDDGSDEARYATGTCKSAGGSPLQGSPGWRDNAWTAVGGGVSDPVWVNTIAGPVDPTTGERSIFVGGNFSKAEGEPASKGARWDGQSWSSLGGSFDFAVDRIIALAPDATSGLNASLPGSNAIYFFGQFSSGPTGDPFLARWGNAAPPNGR